MRTRRTKQYEGNERADIDIFTYAHFVAHALVAILDEALDLLDDRLDLQNGRPEQAEHFAQELETRLDQLRLLALERAHQLLLHDLVALELDVLKQELEGAVANALLHVAHALSHNERGDFLHYIYYLNEISFRYYSLNVTFTSNYTHGIFLFLNEQ